MRTNVTDVFSVQKVQCGNRSFVYNTKQVTNILVVAMAYTLYKPVGDYVDEALIRDGH